MELCLVGGDRHRRSVNKRPCCLFEVRAFSPISLKALPPKKTFERQVWGIDANSIDWTIYTKAEKESLDRRNCQDASVADSCYSAPVRG